jgi:predicted nucleic acid-binding protein
MRIVVTDANIFFDLIGIGALSLFFQLDHEVHTTVLVVDEFSDGDLAALQPFITRSQLLVRSFTAEEMQNVERTGKRKGLRPADRSILLHAHELKALILTGDGSVRKECMDMDLECHGILWCVEQFLANGHYSKDQCLLALDTLQSINKWLPRSKLQELVEKVGRLP